MSQQSDLDFLRGYAGAGGVVQIQNAQGQYITVQPAPITTPLAPIGAAGAAGGGASGGSGPSAAPTQPAPGQPAQTRQQAAQQAAQARQQQRQQAQQAAQARRQRQQTGHRAGIGIIGAAQAGVEKATGPIHAVSNWAETVPTPGGLGAMVLALVFLVSAVVPVNQGYTRLQLAWLTIQGRTHIPESEQATAARSGDTGGSQGGGKQQSLLDQAKTDLQNLRDKLPPIGSGNPTPGASGATRAPAPGAAFGQLPIAPPLPSSGFRPRGYGGNGS